MFLAKEKVWTAEPKVLLFIRNLYRTLVLLEKPFSAQFEIKNPPEEKSRFPFKNI